MLSNLRLFDPLRPTMAGHSIIAHADVTVGEIIIEDVAIVRYSSRQLGVWMPSLVHKREPAVVFTPRLRNLLIEEADTVLRYTSQTAEAA